jgi:putative transposase
MPCPHCAVTTTAEQPGRTALGYRTFRCPGCRRTFNERTGTPLNHLQVPTDIVLLVVLWRLRYKLSLRDLAEMFLARGFTFTHETVREWEARFAPLLTERLRAKRRGAAGSKWRADETYLRVGGSWCYLYRAIDRDGNLVDARLSATRDMGIDGGRPAAGPGLPPPAPPDMATLAAVAVQYHQENIGPPLAPETHPGA